MLNVEVEFAGFGSLMADIEGDVAKAATEAMRETTAVTLGELRGQVTDAGMSQRLANTWRDRVYPEKRESMTPTGYIWSNAPDIIDGFVRGSTIVRRGGTGYLAIPTKNVPNARARIGESGRRIKSGAMTPAEVEHAFNQDLIIKKGRNGSLLGFVSAIRSRNGRTYRQATKGRRGQGRATQDVLMFVFVRSTKLPRLLDIDGPAERWQGRFETAFQARLA